MIIIQPSGGLGNRMRVINSAYILAQKKKCKLYVLWKMCDELNCPFEELFELPKEFKVYNFRSNFNLKKLWMQMSQKQRFANEDIENNKTDGILNEGFFSSLSNSVYISTWEHFYPAKDYHLFIPRKALLEKVDNIAKKFGSHSVGAIEQELKIQPDTKFYLATDDAKEEERLAVRFRDAIITNQNKTLERDSIAGMHDALIDLYCLSKTDKIFGSYYSSFTDIAADMNGIKKIVIGEKK